MKRTPANDSTATLSLDVSGYELLVTGAGPTFAYPLPAAGELSIGRGDDCDVRLGTSSVSRRHAILRIGAGGMTLEDLNSSNGTFIGGMQLTAHRPEPVTPGDSFRVGETVVVVRAWRPRQLSEEPWQELPSTTADNTAPVLNSAAMLALYNQLGPVARTSLSVLVLGETGVGKDVLAQTIHQRSDRREKPFLRINCAAVAEPLLESELFGHEKGAFTGASHAKPGLLLAATGGTVFFDEVGELPPRLQPKLLQVLERQEILSLGSVKPRAIDVRFIAATNRDLKRAIAEGEFRSDLFYRLAAFTAVIPPLRERREDILPLAHEFLRRAALKFGAAAPPLLAAEAETRLLHHAWPGNVRELRNVIERALVLCGGHTVGPEHLALEDPVAPRELPTDATEPALPAAELSAKEWEERRRILDALARCAGNQSKAAELLGVSRSTLVNRLDAYRIGRPRKRPG